MLPLTNNGSAPTLLLFRVGVSKPDLKLNFLLVSTFKREMVRFRLAFRNVLYPFHGGRGAARDAIARAPPGWLCAIGFIAPLMIKYSKLRSTQIVRYAQRGSGRWEGSSLLCLNCVRLQRQRLCGC